MQVIKLVNPGYVDKIIAFNSLPKSMMTSIKKRGSLAGLPRNWKTWFETVVKDDSVNPFYVLDYTSVNPDREKWQEISNYVRRSTDKTFRLLDKLEDMAVVMAPDSQVALTLEPEDIPIIPIVSEIEEIALKEEAKYEESAPLVKKRGRPKKQEVLA